MLKNEFQGGPAFEIFSSQGSAQSLQHWKIHNKAFVKRQFEKDLKGFCHSCENLGKLSFPKDERQQAYLVQPFIVFQIYCATGQPLSIELCISDLSNNHRRFFFSTAHREIKTTALHCGIPLAIVKRSMWLNLTIDLVSLISDNYKGHAFRSLDGITILGTFRLRRIFTLKQQPPDTTGDDFEEPLRFDLRNIETLPKSLDFPLGVTHLTQVINMHRIQYALAEQQTSSRDHPPAAEGPPTTHASLPNIAFGRHTSVTLPPPGKANLRIGASSAQSAASKTSHPRNVFGAKDASSPTPAQSERTASRASAQSAASRSMAGGAPAAAQPPSKQRERKAPVSARTKLPPIGSDSARKDAPSKRHPDDASGPIRELLSASLGNSVRTLETTQRSRSATASSQGSLSLQQRSNPLLQSASVPAPASPARRSQPLPVASGESGARRSRSSTHAYDPDLYTDGEELLGWSHKSDAGREGPSETRGMPDLHAPGISRVALAQGAGDAGNGSEALERDTPSPAERLQREIDAFLRKSSVVNAQLVESVNDGASIPDSRHGADKDASPQSRHTAIAHDSLAHDIAPESNASAATTDFVPPSILSPMQAASGVAHAAEPPETHGDVEPVLGPTQVASTPEDTLAAERAAILASLNKRAHKRAQSQIPPQRQGIVVDLSGSDKHDQGTRAIHRSRSTPFGKDTLDSSAVAPRKLADLGHSDNIPASQPSSRPGSSRTRKDKAESSLTHPTSLADISEAGRASALFHSRRGSGARHSRTASASSAPAVAPRTGPSERPGVSHAKPPALARSPVPLATLQRDAMRRADPGGFTVAAAAEQPHGFEPLHSSSAALVFQPQVDDIERDLEVVAALNPRAIPIEMSLEVAPDVETFAIYDEFGARQELRLGSPKRENGGQKDNYRTNQSIDTAQRAESNEVAGENEAFEDRVDARNAEDDFDETLELEYDEELRCYCDPLTGKLYDIET
ncbi:hypothetical protein HK105_206960 [Polyrhizophydium stewartii]|uniref:CFA20 domain-containing protein n=1 Tax=Polyrhizophydium stewartii TaxID=2732419 RepID=A0ABR4N1V5_9FUNG